MSDLYEATIEWNHLEPRQVTLTGTFDNWSRSIPLTRTPSGFQGKVKVPWGKPFFYKFLVDGNWALKENEPTAVDPIGNVNNVFEVPENPNPSLPETNGHSVPAQQSSTIDSISSTVTSAAGTVHAAVVAPVIAAVASTLPSGTSTITEQTQSTASDLSQKVNGSAVTEAVKEKVITPAADAVKGSLPDPSAEKPNDVASTVASSIPAGLAYVASGLGVAIQQVTGLDPINPVQIPVETPPAEPVSEPVVPVVPEPEPSILAPAVPVEIVPLVPAPEQDKPKELGSPPPVEIASGVPVPDTPAPEVKQSEELFKQTDPAAGISTHTPAEDVGVKPSTEAIAPGIPSAAPAATPAEPEALSTVVESTTPTLETDEPAAATANGTHHHHHVSHHTSSRLSESTPSSTHSTPRKGFPHFHKRTVSESSGSTSGSPSKDGTRRKKKTSIISKIKAVFHHDHHDHHEQSPKNS